MTSSWLPEECGSVTRETVLDGVPRVSSGFQTRCESAPGVTSLEVPAISIRRKVRKPRWGGVTIGADRDSTPTQNPPIAPSRQGIAAVSSTNRVRRRLTARPDHPVGRQTPSGATSAPYVIRDVITQPAVSNRSRGLARRAWPCAQRPAVRM